MPAFGLLAALAFRLAARTYEADMQRAAEPPAERGHRHRCRRPQCACLNAPPASDHH